MTQLPAGKHREHHQGDVQASLRHRRHGGLPAAPDPRGTRTGSEPGSEQQRRGHDRDGDGRPERVGPDSRQAREAEAAFPSGPEVTSAPASLIPANAPATETSANVGSTSAAVSQVSWDLVAPRATSSAVSPSRWVASSRATATSAATASTSSSRALITSINRATARSPAAPASTDGRLETSCAPLRKLESGSDSARAATLADIELGSPWNAVISGCATHVALNIVSVDPSAA